MTSSRSKRGSSVEDRRGVQQHVVLGEAPILQQGLGVRREVAVGQHGALGAPRRAGGIEDGGQVVDGACYIGETRLGPVRRLGEGAGAVGREGREMGNARLAADVVAGRLGGRVDDEDTGFRVAQEIGELRPGIAGVEGQERRARPKAAEVEQQRVG